MYLAEKMACIINRLPPVRIPSFTQLARSFIKLALIVFELARDPYISHHFEYFRYHSNHNFHAITT